MPPTSSIASHIMAHQRSTKRCRVISHSQCLPTANTTLNTTPGSSPSGTASRITLGDRTNTCLSPPSKRVKTAPPPLEQPVTFAYQETSSPHSAYSSSYFNTYKPLAGPKVIAQQLNPPLETLKTRKSYRVQEKSLSYAKQRTLQSIAIINATYAVCQGQSLDGESRSLTL